MERQHLGSLGIAINEDYRSMGIGSVLLKEIISKSKGRFEDTPSGCFCYKQKGDKAL